MAAVRRNPKGWADGLRRAALLVACVPQTVVRGAPFTLRVSQLGPAQGTGDSGTHS